MMIQSINDYLFGALSFIPSAYRQEYKDKLFNELLRCLKITSNANDINILKPKLVSVGSGIKNIDVLKNLFEGTYAGLNLSFSIEENWRIGFRVVASDLYTDKQKEIFLNHLKTIDSSDTSKDWLQAIEGLTKDEEKIKKLFE